MAPTPKRRRQSSNMSVTSRSSRPTASRRSTPLASFKRPSPVAWQQSSRGSASQPAVQRRRVTIASQPRSIRGQPNSQAPVSQADQISAASNAEDETDESLEHVVMAIDLRERGTIGCAYYIAREERLFCMEDIANGGMETVERCMSARLLSIALTARSEGRCAANDRVAFSTSRLWWRRTRCRSRCTSKLSRG